MRKEHNFTLLEVLVVIFLLGIASSVVGWKMHGLVKKKAFQTQVDRLELRLQMVKELALTQEADWRLILTRTEKGWMVEAYSLEEGGKRLPALLLDEMELQFEKKTIRELQFDLFTSGQAFPKGQMICKAFGESRNIRVF